MERRALLEPVEARASDSGCQIAGYGAVFDVETNIGGYFREKVAPGAFSKSLGGDIRSFFNHDSSLILGRTKAGTLRVWEDTRGLRYEVDMPDTQAGRDLAVSMDRGDVDGSSFAFDVTKETWDETGDLPLRTILEAELYELGPVSIPAYPDASVALRSLEGARGERQAGESEPAAAPAPDGEQKRAAWAERQARTFNAQRIHSGIDKYNEDGTRKA